MKKLSLYLGASHTPLRCLKGLTWQKRMLSTRSHPAPTRREQVGNPAQNSCWQGASCLDLLGLARRPTKSASYLTWHRKPAHQKLCQQAIDLCL